MNITSTEYIGLEEAFNYLNQELFNNELSGCLITMQRKSKAAGYYSNNRFVKRMEAEATEDKIYTDEIALNPDNFKYFSDIEILSTLLHEMCHLWQYKKGTPSRGAYHNKEWANKMESVGLMPSSTGKPGGKRVGQKVSDYVIKGGVFEKKAKDLISRGFKVNWESISITGRPQPVPGMESPQGEHGQTKNKNKIKYTCPGCKINAWGKPGLKLICGDCETNLLTETGLTAA